MKNFNAVKHIYPNAEFSMVDDDVNQITWVGQAFPIPTPEQLDAAIREIEAAEEQAKADKEAKKNTALAKLATLGLTADDVAALFN